MVTRLGVYHAAAQAVPFGFKQVTVSGNVEGNAGNERVPSIHLATPRNFG